MAESTLQPQALEQVEFKQEVTSPPAPPVKKKKEVMFFPEYTPHRDSDFSPENPTNDCIIRPNLRTRHKKNYCEFNDQFTQNYGEFICDNGSSCSSCERDRLRGTTNKIFKAKRRRALDNEEEDEEEE